MSSLIAAATAAAAAGAILHSMARMMADWVCRVAMHVVTAAVSAIPHGMASVMGDRIVVKSHDCGCWGIKQSVAGG